MSDESFSDELRRALARPDASKLIRQIDTYIEYLKTDLGDWPEEIADDLGEVFNSAQEDPDKALAYVMIAAARTDDAGFLAFIGAELLESLLRDPSEDFLQRIVAEGRRSARFRWLLSVPYKVAVSEQAWDAIQPFRIAGEHEEPKGDTLPARTRLQRSSTKRP
jgi:hypothetical protein